MTDKEMTPWFPPEIKPVHVGEYNASGAEDPDLRRWWSGSWWSWGYYSTNTDIYIRSAQIKPAVLQSDIHWRGLASKPKGWKP